MLKVQLYVGHDTRCQLAAEKSGSCLLICFVYIDRIGRNFTFCMARESRRRNEEYEDVGVQQYAPRLASIWAKRTKTRPTRALIQLIWSI